MLNINFEWHIQEDISLGLFGKNLLNDRDLIDPLVNFGGASRPRPRTLGLKLGVEF